MKIPGGKGLHGMQLEDPPLRPTTGPSLYEMGEGDRKYTVHAEWSDDERESSTILGVAYIEV